MAAPIPKKIGKYDVIDVVGRGGMGVVYRAKDPFLDRMVAIKIMTISYTDQPDLLQRFYREAKATANLQHPNIVTVYELGEHEGSPYLAMQYLEGSSLDSILRSGQPLSLLQKIDIIVEACHGLSYAHQKGIVHRDIKPGNIMVLKDASVKIVDFGIARIGDTNFTRTGQFMGSLNYMSLEQLNDKLQVDQRTDVYSTGVVLYQILTGALPFEADSTGATLMKILNENPAPFSKYLSSFPPEIETITLKALAKDRDQRYSSADELALDLTQLADRLKHDQIGQHMQQAELLVQQNSLFQANEQLMAVLKLDKQNTKAAAMLRTLRKQIEKEQSTERSRQLREQAEEALRREDFEPALGFVEQAIHLDATNPDLQQLKNKVQAAKAEIDHLRQVMQRAENAHRAGNLDTAKQAIEEVLERRPNDTRVKSLHRMIQKELDERMRQKHMETLLEAARKEITSRRYTAAFDLLKEAEKVDPDSPTVRSLLESLSSARDQEQKRRDLEQFTRQIEQALNTDDPQSALNLLADGLRRFPAEPALLKLKDLAESQNQAAQTKSFVRERIAAAREILNAGNASGALKVLQEALKKAPGNPHLESLVSIAQERLAQDRDDQAKSRCIHQANEAIGKRSYTEAIRILEAGQVQFTASPEIDNLLRFAREQQTKDAKKQDVENSVRRAQEFLKNQEYDRAIELLESLLARTPDEELNIVLEEARRRREALNTQIAAALARGRQFLEEGSPAKAVDFLQAQPTAVRRSPEFLALAQAAASQNVAKKPEAAPLPDFESEAPEPEFEAPEPQRTMIWNPGASPVTTPVPAPRVPKARVTAPSAPLLPPPQGFLQRVTGRQKILVGAVVGVLCIVLIIALWPSSKTGTLIVRSSAEGAEVTVKGKSRGKISGGQLAIKLDEGHYQVSIQQDGQEASAPVDVAKNTEVPVTLDFPAPQPPNPPATGTLSVQANEDGAKILVNGTLKGFTVKGKTEINLPAGVSYAISVEKSGFDKPASQTIEIVSSSTGSVKFSLVKSKGGEGTQTVQESYLALTGPEGADVHIQGGTPENGKLSPNTGLYVKVPPNSSHRVDAHLAGYGPWSHDETVKPGETVQVKVAMDRIAPAKPPASFFALNFPKEQVPPGKVSISWEAKDATSVEIEGVGSFGPTGGTEVAVPQTKTFTLIAKGEGGNSRPETVTINVKEPAVQKPPAIASFTPSATKIKRGESVTFTWSTTDATSTTINGKTVSPSAGGKWSDSPTETTPYVFQANGSGNPAQQSVTITVDQPPPPPPPDGIKAAIKSLSEAYATEDVNEVLKVWPHMSKKTKDQLKEIFNAVRAYKLSYDPCDPAAVTGDTATMVCTKNLSFTPNGGKNTAQPPARVIISLRQVSPGSWQIENEAGK